MLKVENLFKQYESADGTPGGGVFGASFTLAEGELFTLLGPSGCGKTTTLRSVAGLEKPQTGRITLGDVPLFDSDARISVPMYHRDIGMVFQSYAIWPHMSVYDNAAYPLMVGKTRKMSGAEIKMKVMSVLELVGLADFAQRPAPQLSGGQQQRLALARALTREPALLLLDEPLSNLDAQLREQMRYELKRLQRDTGVTTVYVTHDQFEALAISDRIAVMHNGKIVQLGSPRDIYERPRSSFVASFIGRTNLLRGNLGSNVAAGGQGRLETALGPMVSTFAEATNANPNNGVVIRPENIILAASAADLKAEVNCYAGAIATETYLGEIVEYEVDVGGQIILVRTGSDIALHAGDEAHLHFPVGKTLSLIEDDAA